MNAWTLAISNLTKPLAVRQGTHTCALCGMKYTPLKRGDHQSKYCSETCRHRMKTVRKKEKVNASQSQKAGS